MKNRIKRRKSGTTAWNGKMLPLNPFLVSIIVIIILLLANAILKPNKVKMVESSNVINVVETQKVKAEPKEEELIVKEKVVAHQQLNAEKKKYYASKKEATQEVASRSDIRYDIKLSEHLQDFAYAQTKKVQDIDYELVLAILYTESKFNPNAKGYNDDGTVDEGIAQINSRYTNSYAELIQLYNNFNPYNAKHGIMACVYKLQSLADEWRAEGITDKSTLQLYAIQSYHRGVGGFVRYMRENGIATDKYSELILTRKYELKTQGTILTK